MKIIRAMRERENREGKGETERCEEGKRGEPSINP